MRVSWATTHRTSTRTGALCFGSEASAASELDRDSFMSGAANPSRVHVKKIILSRLHHAYTHFGHTCRMLHFAHTPSTKSKRAVRNSPAHLSATRPIPGLVDAPQEQKRVPTQRCSHSLLLPGLLLLIPIHAVLHLYSDPQTHWHGPEATKLKLVHQHDCYEYGNRHWKPERPAREILPPDGQCHPAGRASRASVDCGLSKEPEREESVPTRGAPRRRARAPALAHDGLMTG